VHSASQLAHWHVYTGPYNADAPGYIASQARAAAGPAELARHLIHAMHAGCAKHALACAPHDVVVHDWQLTRLLPASIAPASGAHIAWDAV
jgi:hypothetical protein